MIQKSIKSKELKEHINSFLKKEIYKNKNIQCCPICGGKRYIKHGSYKEIQRYKCKECGNLSQILPIHYGVIQRKI